MTANDVNQSRAKAISVAVHHVKDTVALGQIAFRRVSGTENPADILTKPLEPIHHSRCVSLLGMS